MEGKKVMELLEEVGALLAGHFLLSSGVHSPVYIQCASALQFPRHAEKLCRAIAEKQTGKKCDVVVGPAIGGIIVAHEVARVLGVRALFTEREKDRMRLRRGFCLKPGERILLVEDVVTTGASLREAADFLVAQGGLIEGAGCIVDRRTEPTELEFELRPLLSLPSPVYPPESCPLCGKGTPVEKPGSRKR